MIYKNIAIKQTAAMLSCVIDGFRLSATTLPRLQRKIDNALCVPGSNRAGQSHKSWLGTFTANTCAAICTAIIRELGYFGCMACTKPLALTTPKEAGFQADHYITIKFSDSNGLKRNHTASNCNILCETCHKEKTRTDNVGLAIPFDAVQVARMEAIRTLASQLTKDDYRETGKELAKHSVKFARLFAGGMYKRLYWPD